MTTPYPLVGIVIVNWNGARDTLACLASLQNLQYPNHSIIVVDNASTDSSIQRIQEAYPEIEFIQSNTNLGFAGGNNIGIQRALELNADYIWLLNNDTEVDSDALTYLVKRLSQDKMIGMCGSTLIYSNNRDIVQAFGGARYDKWRGVAEHIGQGVTRQTVPPLEKVENQLAYIVFASALVSKTFVADVGLMAEDYFLYYEEIDWARRGHPKYKLAYAPQSIVYHKVGSSIGTSDTSHNKKRLRSEYYLTRSRFLFTWRYFPYALPTVFLNILVTILIRLARGQWSRARTLTTALWLVISGKNIMGKL
jgi:GT2 family glycosyltransferase